ncbi:MAG TPA: DUF4124 domain-containing protein [Pseudomonas sp.]|nr:DUF4124 domain-containing protein [Pseudomonas sp.]
MALDVQKTLVAALLTLAPCAFATTVNRCEDGHGNLTFTTLACPPGHSLKLHRAHNPLPGTTPTAPPAIAESGRERTNKELVVIGQRDDGCGNILSAQQRRKAIIDERTPAGMTKRDVESLLGKPDKVVGRNAELRYIYETKKGRSRQVIFDEHGCVKGKREKTRP